MFSLYDLHLCSLDLDVLHTQRITDFFILITHTSVRSGNLIRLYQEAFRNHLSFLDNFRSPDGSPGKQGISESEFMERIRERMAQEVSGYVSISPCQ